MWQNQGFLTSWRRVRFETDVLARGELQISSREPKCKGMNISKPSLWHLERSQSESLTLLTNAEIPSFLNRSWYYLFSGNKYKSSYRLSSMILTFNSYSWNVSHASHAVASDSGFRWNTRWNHHSGLQRWRCLQKSRWVHFTIDFFINKKRWAFLFLSLTTTFSSLVHIEINCTWL